MDYRSHPSSEDGPEIRSADELAAWMKFVLRTIDAAIA